MPLNLPTPPPPAPKKTSAKLTPTGAFQSMLNRFPAWKRYAQQIAFQAKQYSMDPAQLMAVLVYEGQSADPNKRNTQSGALGLAQIKDVNRSKLNQSGHPFVSDPGGTTISDAQKRDPNYAIEYVAWRISGQMQTGKSLDQAYKTYVGGPSYTGEIPPESIGTSPENVIQGTVSKKYPNQTYVPPPSQTPGGQAGKDLANKLATQTLRPLTDPWVVMKADGTVKYDTSPTPPKNVLKAGGLPVPRSYYLDQSKTMSDDFMAYSGRPPTPGQVAMVIQKNWGTFQLRQWLTERPSFVGSPTWQHVAPTYQAAWANLMGDNSKPPTKLIQTAAANNWDTTTFQYEARKSPAYVSSANFQNDQAGFEQSYARIYGTPDNNAKNAAAQAALSGWSDTQWTAWLRSQPAYQHSAEYQAQVLQIMDKLGMDFGFVPTFRPAPAGVPQGAEAGDVQGAPWTSVPGGNMILPNDPRMPAAKPMLAGVGPTSSWDITVPTAGR